MIAGFRRSSGVIELMIASVRAIWRSSTSRSFSCCFPPGIAGEHREEVLRAGPSFLTSRICTRKSSSVNCERGHLLRGLGGLLLVELLLRLLDQREHVAHAEDPGGHAVGMERLEVPGLSPVPAK